ncbi:hypothetical protein RM697_07210 [Ichthyenterobacterium sp. W332]|uniref:Prenyltransferase n=1 Tax=Microcosmobacter mediterraneus TaxID=3075607 RepID=A0ABU2YJT1_9FLAO|nr:hypothetical protein [Ichthyenterobacterium sp. W332]MDT0558428.1 hypothetical protein [Ichthyenterobacterium sp. W332]
MVRLLKNIFDFYLNASIHVALAVYALSWITLKEFGLLYDDSVLYFIFYATITGYNFIKYFGLAKFHHRSLARWLKVIQIFSAICFVLMCFYAFQLSTKTLWYLSVFGIVTFLYAIPFLPKKIFLDDQKNLRSISGLKIYIISLVWAGVSVLIPLINADYDILKQEVIITLIQRFLLIMVLMLPFEIRDLNFDSLKLATLPQRIGIKNTKTIGLLLLVFFFILEFLKPEFHVNEVVAVLLIFFLTALFLIFSKTNQNRYYSAFWVESIPVLWLVIVLVLG